MTWHDNAECRKHPPGTMWIPEGGGDIPARRVHIANAVAICRSCPVLVDCHRWLQEEPRMVGVVVAGQVCEPVDGRRQRRRVAA